MKELIRIIRLYQILVTLPDLEIINSRDANELSLNEEEELPIYDKRLSQKITQNSYTYNKNCHNLDLFAGIFLIRRIICK